MCVVSMKSMTMAIKAQKALNNALINCEIIKLEPHMTQKGCAYGIKFDCINTYAVMNVLNDKKIKFTEIFNL